MRIAHLITTFIAVLAAVLTPRCGAQENNSYSVRRSARSSPPISNNHNPHLEDIYGQQWPTTRELREFVKRESRKGSVDCCPSVLEMVEPHSGKNENGLLVELYREGQNKQRFYELSCIESVLGKPCRFVDRKMYNQSQCVQKYSYSYALVRDTNSHNESSHRGFTNFHNGKWMMDYIQVRSGCACQMGSKVRHSIKRGERKDRRYPHQQTYQQSLHQYQSPRQQPHHRHHPTSRA